MKGILFKPAIWAAKKKVLEQCGMAVTRRVAGLKEINQEPDKWDYMRTNNDGRALFWRSSGTASATLNDPDNIRLIKPRYQVGETVYIKEAHYRYGYWRETGGVTENGRVECEFKADDIEVRFESPYPSELPRTQLGWHKRTPLFMPAWAARYFIKITDVRAERLQEITGKEIIKEGIFEGMYYMSDLEKQSLFKSLWNSINKDYLWESNPWVWRYEFEAVK